MECFQKAGRPLGASELLEAASKELPQINLATIYRNLRLLIEEKILTMVELPGQTPRYECHGLENHHHFLCDRCNRLYDIEPAAIKPSLLPQGFLMTGFDLTMHGLCVDCCPA